MVVFDEPIVGNFEGRKLKITSPSLEVDIFRETLSKAGRSHAPYSKLEDAELLPIIRRLLDRRPTSGYRRVAVSIAMPKVMVMRCCSDCLEFTCWYGDVRLRGPDKAVGEVGIPILHAISPRGQQAAARPLPSSQTRNSAMSAGGVLVACKHCERRRQDVAPDSGEALRRREVDSLQRLTG